MHEMGIAASVVEAVEKELAMRPGARLLRIGLRVGAMSGVDTESLGFCLECLMREVAIDFERTDDDALDLAHLELEVDE